MTVSAMAMAPVWCSIIMPSHRSSKASPASSSSASMSSALIMPSMLAMSCPSDVSIATGWPHASSHPVMSSISGSCAPLMRVARSVTSLPAPLAGSSAMSAISTACSWWGIMPWAKVTSASLNSVVASASCPEGAEPSSDESASLPQALVTAATRTMGIRRRRTIMWGVLSGYFYTV